MGGVNVSINKKWLVCPMNMIQSALCSSTLGQHDKYLFWCHWTYRKFFTVAWSWKTPQKSHFFNKIRSKYQAWMGVPKLKNQWLLTFAPIEIDWHIIRPPRLFLRVAMDPGKCLETYLVFQSLLENFTQRHKVICFICWNTIFYMRFLLNYYKNLKNNNKICKN